MLTTQPVYDRGLAIHAAGQVHKTPHKGLFTVNGYTVDLRGSETCTCPYYTHRQAPCKHIVASMRRQLDPIRYRAS
jgi:uncharacterized Zn finger protein